MPWVFLVVVTAQKISEEDKTKTPLIHTTL